MTLTEFLLARIAEDEETAKAARPYRLPYSSTPPESADEWSHERAKVAFQGQWMPSRVLAECEAKRRIVENWRLYSEAQFPDYEGGYLSAMDDVLKLLALPYADHEDFREEWRP